MNWCQSYLERNVFERKKNTKQNKSCLEHEAWLSIMTESPNAYYDTLMHMFEYDHRSCRSENQNTSVILPRRWSSYVIWFALYIRVEAWVAQVISYGGIDEGNSNTGCSVWIVGRNGCMRM